MQINELKIGKKIYVSVKCEDDVLDKDCELPSQIVDIIDENEFIISAPFYKANVITLQMDDYLNIAFTYENGLYIFDGKVIWSHEENGITLYRIKVKSKIQKLQRRQHFRLIHTVPIVFQWLRDGQEKYGQGMTKDISGGGLKFVCGDKFQTDELLDIFVRLGPDMEIKTSGKVKRCDIISEHRYEVSITFESLSFGKREVLIKYIFDLQRDNLKNR